MDTPFSLSQSFLSHIQAANRISAPLQPKDWHRLAVRSSAGAGNPKGSRLTLAPAATTQIEAVISELFGKLESEPVLSQTSFDRHFLDVIGEVTVAAWSMTRSTLLE